jgi:predicted component of type VI protein secretion system
MPCSLFDSLIGFYAADTPYGSAALWEQNTKLIESHLCRLFRIRQGSDPLRPAMGVRDGGEVTILIKTNLKSLQQELAAKIEEHEPRFEKVRFRQ